MSTKTDATNSQTQPALRAAWNACDSVVMRITDTDGSNPANAAVRHLSGATWLSVCDDDGFTLLSASEVRSLENAGCLVAD